MTQYITAIFENGILKPTTPLTGIPEEAKVRIIIEFTPPFSKEE